MPDLAARCRSADRKAQEHIFRTYYSDYLKICLRYAADRHAAELMLSDAFFRIFTKADSYQGTGSFEGWMRRIVVNTCLSHLRSAGNHAAQPLPGGSSGEDGHLVQTAALQSDNDALSRLGMQELIRLIQALPPVSRTVFNLYVFDGYTHKEIAASLGISEGTSQWHLSTARQWLRSKI